MARDGRADRTRRAYNLHLIDDADCPGGMPMLDAVDVDAPCLRAFNTCPRATDYGAGVHFFLDDYRFEGTWSDPARYVPMLARFAFCLTPDFSCYLDMPEPMQRWNVYRGRAVGRIWQDAGLLVVPTLTWGGPETYGFSFAGLPRDSTVAVSTVGLMDCPEGVELFRAGAGAACAALSPRRVLAYGNRCDFDAAGAEVRWYESGMYARLRKIQSR